PSPTLILTSVLQAVSAAANVMSGKVISEASRAMVQPPMSGRERVLVRRKEQLISPLRRPLYGLKLPGLFGRLDGQIATARSSRSSDRASTSHESAWRSNLSSDSSFTRRA